MKNTKSIKMIFFLNDFQISVTYKWLVDNKTAF